MQMKNNKGEIVAEQKWPQLAQAFDFPWLTHDTDKHKEALAQLAFAYLDGDSLPHAIQDVEASLKRS